MCELCEGLGLIPLGVHRPAEGYQQIGVCLCLKGRHLRQQIPRGLYALLAKTHQLAVEDIGLIEEMIDTKDLPVSLRPKAAVVDIGAAGARQMKGRL